MGRGAGKKRLYRGGNHWAALKDEWDVFQAEEKGVRPVETE